MERAYWKENGVHKEGDLAEAFPFLSERGHMIALVGAGGKSSLMYAMAKLQSVRGFHTAVTTTTHIYVPDKTVSCRSMDDCRMKWKEGRYAVWGNPSEDPQKLGPLSRDQLLQLREADTVLIEADGARHFPLKAPAEHEPVIPEEADIVVAVVGLTACGQPMKKACFRWELASELLHCSPDHCLEAVDLARLLSSKRAARKDVKNRTYYAVLNQCEGRRRYSYGLEILEILKAGHVENAVMTTLIPDKKAGENNEAE